jgi:uncharacterized DUF497 family protein
MEFGSKKLKLFRRSKFSSFFDDEHSEAEDRFLILGLSATGRLLIVVHCYRKVDSVVRVISARKATRRESKKYEERI